MYYRQGVDDDMSLRSAICVCATGLLLGAVFSRWVVDYGILWQSPVLPSAQLSAERYYAQPEPAWLLQAFAGIAAIAVAALISRLAQGSTSSVLFDGGSVGPLCIDSAIPFKGLMILVQCCI